MFDLEASQVFAVIFRPRPSNNTMDVLLLMFLTLALPGPIAALLAFFALRYWCPQPQDDYVTIA